MKKLINVFFLFLFIFITNEGCKTKSEDASLESEKIEVKASQPLHVNFTLLEDSVKAKSVQVLADSGFYECAVKINVSANWLSITHPSGASQRITFPDMRGPKYGLNFKIRTNLNKDSVTIYDYYYRAITGGVTEIKKIGIVPECDNETLSLNYYIYTQNKMMTGKFIILYTKK